MRLFLFLALVCLSVGAQGAAAANASLADSASFPVSISNSSGTAGKPSVKKVVSNKFVSPVRMESRAEPGSMLSKSLVQLGAPREGLYMRGWDARAVIKLPKAPRETLGDFWLHLEGANSPALIKSRSALTVRIGGTVIGSRQLDPQESRFNWDLRIPAKLLRDGYNDLTLTAVQHYTYQCEDPMGSELWTEIDTQRSTLTTEVRGLIANPMPKVTQLPLIFDARLWQPRAVRFVFGNEYPAPDMVTAAAYVSQGIALLRQRQPYALTVHTAQSALVSAANSSDAPGLNETLARDADIVLVGTRAEITRYLRGDVDKMIDGPFLGVLPLQDGLAAAVVVSGRNPEEVMRAARALAVPDFKHTDAPFEIVENVPELPLPFAVDLGETRSFHALGYRTQSRYGLDSTPFGVEFRVPAELLGRKDLPVTLNLHFSYGASMRAGSVLNFIVNGKFINAIPMSDPAGAEYRDFKLEIPTSALQPGMNVLHVEPVLRGDKGACEMFRPEQLVATVFDDSSMAMPRSSPVPPLPDLERFAKAAWPGSNPLRFHLMSFDTESIAATLSMFAGLAAYQQRIIPLQPVTEIPSMDNVLVIGPEARLPTVDALRPLNASYGWQAQGSNAAVVQGLDNGRVITAVLAQDPTMLHKGMEQLSRLGLWSGVAGSATIVDTAEERLSVEPARHQETLRAQSGWSMWFSSWETLTVGALVLAVIFATVVLFVIKRLAKRRMGH